MSAAEVLELVDVGPPSTGPAVVRPSIGVADIRREIDAYLAEMQRLKSYEPDEVFRKLSAWTARAAEIRMQLVRLEHSRADRLVEREIKPFIDDCERQYRYHSRIHSVRETDAKLVGGFA